MKSRALTLIFLAAVAQSLVFGHGRILALSKDDGAAPNNLTPPVDTLTADDKKITKPLGRYRFLGIQVGRASTSFDYETEARRCFSGIHMEVLPGYDMDDQHLREKEMEAETIRLFGEAYVPRVISAGKIFLDKSRRLRKVNVWLTSNNCKKQEVREENSADYTISVTASSISRSPLHFKVKGPTEGGPSGYTVELWKDDDRIGLQASAEEMSRWVSQMIGRDIKINANDPIMTELASKQEIKTILEFPEVQPVELNNWATEDQRENRKREDEAQISPRRLMISDSNFPDLVPLGKPQKAKAKPRNQNTGAGSLAVQIIADADSKARESAAQQRKSGGPN